jgi:hypothetical protein
MKFNSCSFVQQIPSKMSKNVNLKKQEKPFFWWQNTKIHFIILLSEYYIYLFILII